MVLFNLSFVLARVLLDPLDPEAHFVRSDAGGDPAVAQLSCAPIGWLASAANPDRHWAAWLRLDDHLVQAVEASLKTHRFSVPELFHHHQGFIQARAALP